MCRESFQELQTTRAAAYGQIHRIAKQLNEMKLVNVDMIFQGFGSDMGTSSAVGQVMLYMISYTVS